MPATSFDIRCSFEKHENREVVEVLLAQECRCQSKSLRLLGRDIIRSLLGRLLVKGVRQILQPERVIWLLSTTQQTTETLVSVRRTIFCIKLWLKNGSLNTSWAAVSSDNALSRVTRSILSNDMNVEQMRRFGETKWFVWVASATLTICMHWGVTWDHKPSGGETSVQPS